MERANLQTEKGAMRKAFAVLVVVTLAATGAFAGEVQADGPMALLEVRPQAGVPYNQDRLDRRTQLYTMIITSAGAILGNAMKSDAFRETEWYRDNVPDEPQALRDLYTLQEDSSAEARPEQADREVIDTYRQAVDDAEQALLEMLSIEALPEANAIRITAPGMDDDSEARRLIVALVETSMEYLVAGDGFMREARIGALMDRLDDLSEQRRRRPDDETLGRHYASLLQELTRLQIQAQTYRPVVVRTMP